MTYFLESKRVGLRVLCEDDVNGNYRFWLNDGLVCKYNSHHKFPATIEDLRAYIKRGYQDKSMIVLAIVFKDNSEHIGNVALQDIDYISRCAEFAMLLGQQSYWRQGIGKEVGQLIIDHGFIELGLNRINLGASAENIGTQKLAENLGFIKEGVRRKMLYKNGKFNDIIEYGLLRSDWEKKHNNYTFEK